MTNFLEIDGSVGEGGGQTIRIATSFSIIFNQPIHVINVRGGRAVPGLRPQHAATLNLLKDICGGTLDGGTVGSTEFAFTPGSLKSVSPTPLDLGTAGSMTLVLQALVPAVALSRASLDLELIGGTDVPWSPTCDYITEVLGHCLQRMGITFNLEVFRRGYYPKGGGQVKVSIEPCEEVLPLQLTSRRRERTPPISIISRAGSLPRHVAERQASAASSMLARNGLRTRATTIQSEESYSPGSSILISCVDDSFYGGSDALGARGKPAERVGAEAATTFVKTYASPACVDANLADMVAPLLCMAGGPSNLVTSHATGHLRTSLHVATRFAKADYHVEALDDGGALVSISPQQQNS